MTIRLHDAQHERLRQLDRTLGVSINKVIEDLVTQELAEFDLEREFGTRAAWGDPGRVPHFLDQEEAGTVLEAGRSQT